MFRFSKRKPCEHKKNYRSRTYLSEDGTPMVEFECHDCGFRDSGHVYADAENYPQKLVIVKDGVAIV